LSKITDQEVKSFLREFKTLIRTRHFHVVPRYDNNQALIALGINRKKQKKLLLELGKLNYSSGPKRDVDRNGEVWIFGTTINTTEIYIKLKIIYHPSGNKAKCLSFHPAEEPLTYPLRPEKTTFET